MLWNDGKSQSDRNQRVLTIDFSKVEVGDRRARRGVAHREVRGSRRGARRDIDVVGASELVNGLGRGRRREDRTRDVGGRVREEEGHRASGASMSVVVRVGWVVSEDQGAYHSSVLSSSCMPEHLRSERLRLRMVVCRRAGMFVLASQLLG